jgi:GntR family carbon starvation induced transcriptional regulator
MSNVVPMPHEAARSQTLATSVFERIRNDILEGLLVPGEKLRIEALRTRYNVGASPVREALNRLATQGLVTQIDQKGFRVSPVSVEEMAELTRTRCLTNEIALRESIANGDAAWEERLLLAYHRLARLARQLKAGDTSVRPEMGLRHREFHTALISACGSHWLLEFSEMLFDCAKRYQRLSMLAGAAPRDIEAEHKPILDAVLARDTETALKLLNQHVSLTADIVSRWNPRD